MRHPPPVFELGGEAASAAMADVRPAAPRPREKELTPAEQWAVVERMTREAIAEGRHSARPLVMCDRCRAMVEGNWWQLQGSCVADRKSVCLACAAELGVGGAREYLAKVAARAAAGGGAR